MIRIMEKRGYSHYLLKHKKGGIINSEYGRPYIIIEDRTVSRNALNI